MPAQISLLTRRVSRDWTISSLAQPDVDIVVPTKFDYVTGMRLPDGTTYHNRRQATTIRLGRLLFAERGEDDSITLPDEKATRLISLFRKLRPGHGLECHDLLCEVEQWPTDFDYDSKILSRSESIIPGRPYSIISNLGSASNPNWMDTHSCMGTDNGNLLGIIGNGLMMTVMKQDATERLYARGGVPHLAEVIPPSKSVTNT
jgi:hypothetical protein